MRVVEPSFKLSNPYSENFIREDGIRLLQFIEKQARISHRSEEKQTPNSWERFIKAVVLEHGDWSVTEHASITATLRVDRGVTHELVRHRLFSFTQESTRFVNYQKKGKMEFIKPVFPDDIDSVFNTPKYDFVWSTAMRDAEQSYLDLLNDGLSPQLARSVLPNSLAATIAITGNLRNWRHFFLMRTSKESHPDFRRISIPMLKEFKQVIPLLYDDIEPNARQINNLKKAR